MENANYMYFTSFGAKAQIVRYEAQVDALYIQFLETTLTTA